jgi:NADPH-dependent glutamate synthase beta subunit-like oxidoreductase
MDQKELHELEALCIQEEPPGCRAGCPLGVDARGFVLAMADEDPVAGRAILEKSMPLAGIVARLCEAPCEQYCRRKSLGGPLAIGRLERVCIEAVPSKAKFFKLPPKPKKVAVIGGGPSSLTVAHDLAKKGHPVHLYHTGEAPGGWLRRLPDNLLDPGPVQHRRCPQNRPGTGDYIWK